MGDDSHDDARRAAEENLRLKRTVKDSVFCKLFSDPKYVLELYRVLHPEDVTATVEDVDVLTLERVITTGLYNDLGFAVGERLLVLVEAQSSWSPNIALRAFFYAAETLKVWVRRRNLDVYGSRRIKLPRPELYVVYTGSNKAPHEVALSESFLGKGVGCVESRVIVVQADGDDIVGQYVSMSHAADRFKADMGPTEEAARATWDYCVSHGILRDFLMEHESEVLSMWVTLFDEEELQRISREAAVHEAAEEARARGLASGMAEGLERGMAQGMAQGMERGMAQGMAEGITKGKLEGREQERLSAITSVMARLELTAKEAMEAIGIPEAEMPHYLAML